MRRHLNKNEFGIELILDLYQCDPEIIRSEEKLKEYVDKLCKILEMKKYKECHIHHFGHNSEKTAGYSLLQFIETSSITGHFAEATNNAYLNIFSCKSYDAKKAVDFTKDFFKAKKVKKKIIVRK